MGKRNILAVTILIGGTAASFYCYARLAQLLPMSDADAVTHVEATITKVSAPMVKKGENTSDVNNDVYFMFQAAGSDYTGNYSVRGYDKAPERNTKLPVVYYTSRPAIFLQQAEYDDLPQQLQVLRILMISFALVAIIAPFGVMRHGPAH